MKERKLNCYYVTWRNCSTGVYYREEYKYRKSAFRLYSLLTSQPYVSNIDFVCFNPSGELIEKHYLVKGCSE